MTRTRRKHAPARRRTWGDSHREQLACGFDYFSEAWGDVPFSDAVLADMRAAWQTFGGDILAEWPTRHPGSRPWAWWQFDAPEPRDASASEEWQLDHFGLMNDSERQAVRRRDVRTAADTQRRFRRPWSWWCFASPEPRDTSVSEAEQLQAIGALTAIEKRILAEPTAQWCRGPSEGTEPQHWLTHLTRTEREFVGLE